MNSGFFYWFQGLDSSTSRFSVPRKCQETFYVWSGFTSCQGIELSLLKDVLITVADKGVTNRFCALGWSVLSTRLRREAGGRRVFSRTCPRDTKTPAIAVGSMHLILIAGQGRAAPVWLLWLDSVELLLPSRILKLKPFICYSMLCSKSW